MSSKIREKRYSMHESPIKVKRGNQSIHRMNWFFGETTYLVFNGGFNIRACDKFFRKNFDETGNIFFKAGHMSCQLWSFGQKCLHLLCECIFKITQCCTHFAYSLANLSLNGFSKNFFRKNHQSHATYDMLHMTCNI